MADVNIKDLTALTGPADGVDAIEIYDDSASQNKYIEIHELLNKFDSDEMITRYGALWEAIVYDNGNWSRNSNGALVDADVKWSVFLEGATDGRLTGTPDTTFVHLLKTVALTYPDRSKTVTFTGTYAADGTFKPSAPTVTP